MSSVVFHPEAAPDSADYISALEVMSDIRQSVLSQGIVAAAEIITQRAVDLKAADEVLDEALGSREQLLAELAVERAQEITRFTGEILPEVIDEAADDITYVAGELAPREVILQAEEITREAAS